jgi:hypothetical protein
MKHPGVRILLGILAFVLLVVVLAGGVIWFKIAALKNQLAQDLGHTLHAQVEVTSLSLDVWKGEIHAAGITLTNQDPAAPWESGEISQATIGFHLRDLLAPILPVSVEVSSWRVVLHPYAEAAGGGGASPASGSETPGQGGASPHHVQVTQLSAEEGEVEIDLAPDRKILVHGVAFDSSRTGGSVWTTQVRADSISAGTLQVGASAVDLRSDSGQLTFQNLHMQCAQGMITGGGQVGLDGSHDTKIDLHAFNVPVTMLVAIEWQVKLSGLITGDLAYEGNDQGSEAHGQLAVAGGKFNVLPFLSKLAGMVGLPDLAGVEVDQATANYQWKDHVFHLTDIDVRKNDVTRIAGAVDVDSNNQVDGHIKVGLPDAVLTRWPQMQSGVFSTEFENYGWADVHITGTPDHLDEDLSPRLLAVGIQSGSSLLNQGAQKAQDLLKSLIGP